MDKGIDQPILVRELKGKELRDTAIKMLSGEKGKDFALYECDSAWWKVRLQTRIN